MSTKSERRQFTEKNMKTTLHHVPHSENNMDHFYGTVAKTATKKKKKKIAYRYRDKKKKK